ncbi:AbrB/MazE/SpoVT family DNA-binding domain-containing protein [Falsiroseomonas sp.]|uniref:AbrB/MazE/SpoVT family DNA-binding domain-containing protein n=1 Tax=Falsiroseomonas sp. TaxID=2870721 RepID=UPI003F70DB28
MATLKLRSIGNSVGVVLPKEMLAKLDLQEGDTLEVVNTPEGFMLMAVNPEEAEQLRVGREVMKRYRNVLRELAK